MIKTLLCSLLMLNIMFNTNHLSADDTTVFPGQIYNNSDHHIIAQRDNEDGTFAYMSVAPYTHTAYWEDWDFVTDPLANAITGTVTWYKVGPHTLTYTCDRYWLIFGGFITVNPVNTGWTPPAPPYGPIQPYVPQIPEPQTMIHLFP